AQARSLPVLFSLTAQRGPDGRLITFAGHRLDQQARRAKRHYDIAALGFNCGREIGVDDLLAVVRRYRELTDLPIFVRPNAGTPPCVGARWVSRRTPADMAARLPELLEAGVSMVGGCCGTTPDHIAAFRPILDAWNARRLSP